MSFSIFYYSNTHISVHHRLEERSDLYLLA